MSAAEKIAKLESLLERIQQNRVEAPVQHDVSAVAAAHAAPDEELDALSADIAEDAAKTTPPPAMHADSVERTIGYDAPLPAVPASAVIGGPRAKAPTPMEQAVSTELELGPMDDDDEPELEISYPDEDEPALLLDSAEADAFEAAEPEVTLAEPTVEEPTVREPLPQDAMPTAPVHTRSPEPEPEASRIDVAPAKPSAPIAKVVSRPQPRTFGELLERALALRPR